MIDFSGKLIKKNDFIILAAKETKDFCKLKFNKDCKM